MTKSNTSVIDANFLVRLRFVQLFRNEECLDPDIVHSFVMSSNVSPIVLADLIEERNGKVCLSDYGKQLLKLIIEHK